MWSSCERTIGMVYVIPVRLLGSPNARPLTFLATSTYRSRSPGDTVSTSAMLSKPWADSSAGSSAVPSISSASRSRMVLVYSNRLRRWMDIRPGFGAAAAARSSPASSHVTKPSRVAFSGCGKPAGGMMPARSFRTTFSQTSAPAPTSLRSVLSRVRPAVLSRSL